MGDTAYFQHTGTYYTCFECNKADVERVNIMDLKGVRIGLAITGSFCTYEKVYSEVEKLVNIGAKVTPIFSYNGATFDSRFGKAKDWVEKFETLTGSKSIMTIPDAEPVGPKNMFDILVVAPCTEKTTNIQNYSVR